MKTRILAVTRTICALALAVTLCVMPARSVRGDEPLPNIWINLFSLDSTYLGQPVPVDAQIVVFDPQTGVQCGQFAVTYAGWYGTMPCYGDDGVYPGATPGHVLGFTINGATAQTEAVSLNGTPIPATTPVYWDQELSLWEVNLRARLDVGQHTLVSSANPANLAQTVTFSTVVTGSGPNGEKPTGSVQFAADGAPLGAATLDAYGQATLSTADLAAGTHTMTAAYLGDAAFYPSTTGLTQEVRPYEERCGLTTGAHDFSASGPVHVEVGELGSLFCLRVQRVAGSHPQATPGIATGQYWIIEGTDNLGDPAGGFSVALTLPANFTPDAEDKLCRYTGTGQIWDCAASSFDAVNRTVTRGTWANSRSGPWVTTSVPPR